MIEVARIPLAVATASGSGILLDSVGAGASPWDRWSYRPGPAVEILQCDSASLVTTLRGAKGEERRWIDPLAALEWLGESYAQDNVSGGPPFNGGWIGSLSYDLGRLFEDIGGAALDDLTLPLFTFTRHDCVTAIDHQKGRAYACR